MLAALLSSCGGGRGGAPAPPANQAPSFTSATAVSVAENVSGPIYTATATDPNGDPLTFAVAGGPDAARFTISSGGVIAFAAPPDFEAPADADRDNVYRIQLSVSDGRGGQATLDLAITVINQAGDAFRVRRAGAGFVQPLYLTGIPDNSGRERGLLGLALARDFATSGAFYVYLTNLAGNTELRRYRTLAGNRDQADPASADLILTFPQPFANHNGGWIEFGPEGFLYVASGDGGSGGDPQNNAQNTASLLGKMLRIDVASDAFPADPARDYAIPASNPFAGGGGAPEVFAFGLRNPFRASFDPATGNLYLGDVGQSAIEEIDLIPPNRPGLNFGWARLEGTRTFNGAPPAGAIPPVTEYSHGTGPLQGNSVTGGYVYRGPVEALQGLYIFGDFVRGRLWSVPASSLVLGQTLASSAFTVRNTDFAPNAGAVGNVASFGEDQRRNLYIVDYDGEIFVIEPG
ncbi:MAG: PQQ-dependent sugar dehydrogenase [Novosphingobium sp.]|nr:PQQ-dependent sugar dehydrogenase [Novosphingobium sp.]